MQARLKIGLNNVYPRCSLTNTIEQELLQASGTWEYLVLLN